MSAIQKLGLSGNTGTTVTASASAHTLGTWVSLGTLSVDARALIVYVHSTSSDGSRLALSLAGGAAHGTPLVDHWPVERGASGAGTGSRAPRQQRIPFGTVIPAGTEIWAAVQSSVGSKACVVLVEADPGGPLGSGGAYWHAYGFDAANTQGVSVTPDATANTKTATPVTIDADIDQDIFAVFVHIDQLTAVAANRSYLTDILKAGNIDIPDLFDLDSNTLDTLFPMTHGPYFVNWAALSAITAAAACTSASGDAVRVYLSGTNLTYSAGSGAADPLAEGELVAA